MESTAKPGRRTLITQKTPNAQQQANSVKMVQVANETNDGKPFKIKK